MKIFSLRLFAGIWILLALAGCSSTPQSSLLMEEGLTSAYRLPVTLSDVPFYPQEKYQCGPAALAMLLQTSQVDVVPDDLVPLVYLPAREGSLQIEMLAASRTFERISYPLPPKLESILAEIQQGRPVLVMQNLGLDWYPRWHYAVVIGYDLSQGELVLHSGTRQNYRIGLGLFERTWRRADYWSLVVLRPGELPADKDETRYFSALSALEHAQPEMNLQSAYQAGLRQWPQSTLLGMGLANLYYRRGKLAEAAEHYARLIKTSPRYAPAHNNLAQVLLELGDTDSALRHARMAVALGGDLLPTYQITLDSLTEK